MSKFTNVITCLEADRYSQPRNFGRLMKNNLGIVYFEFRCGVCHRADGFCQIYARRGKTVNQIEISGIHLLAKTFERKKALGVAKREAAKSNADPNRRRLTCGEV